MLLIDWILCAALGLGIAVWWMTRVQARRHIVGVASLVALAVGLVAVMDHRWQAIGGVAGLLFIFQVATLPGPSGEHPVGVRDFELADDTRKGVLAADENAPLTDAAANRPVVIYSHGYTSFLGQNTALMEELASHGYIVYSAQHTYDSSPVVFPNGDVAAMCPTRWPA